MQFIVTNKFVSVQSISPEQRSQLSLWLRAKAPQPPGRYQPRTGWDGYQHFLTKKNCFPVGLLPYTLRKLEGKKWPVELVDQRVGKPGVANRTVQGLELYAHQEAAVVSVLQNQAGGLWFPSGIIEIGTGGGKTACMAQLAVSFAGNVLVLAHRRGLIAQLVEELHKLTGEPIGLLHQSTMQVERITVGSFQTLYANLDGAKETLERFHAVLVDEAHHIPAKSYYKVLQATPAYARIGFSATPLREDNPLHMARLRAQTGDILHVTRSHTLIAEDKLTPVTIYYQKVEQPKSVKGYPAARLPYREEDGLPGAYEELIVRNPIRNQYIAEWVTTRPGVTLVLVNLLEHGRLLADLIGCPFLSGEDKDSKRQMLINQMRAGTLTRLVATTIFDEGTNIPAIKHLALAGGGKAPWQLKQRIGRGMRKIAGNDGELEVFDCLDLTHRVIAAHSRARVNAAAKAGFKVCMLSR